MAPKFRVPKCVDDLMEVPNDDDGDALYAQNVIEIGSMNASEQRRLIAGIADELSHKEVLCVQEQSIFDRVYSVARGYAHLEVSLKTILIDSLCTNFVQLNVSASVLITSIDDPNEDAEDVTLQCRAHCNAIKIYAYFLSYILIAEEEEPESPAGKGSEKSGGSQGRPRKKHVPGDWDWNALSTRSLRVLAVALQNDLKKIFESPQLDENFIAFVAKAAFKMLENRSLLEKSECNQPLCSIISSCTVQYGYGISSVMTIIDMLHKFEHLPVHMADLVSSAENQYNGGSSLAVDLLRTIGKINPVNFERDSAGAENVGKFLEELAARLPKIVVTNLSVILCHLDGKSHRMRNSLVIVIGRLHVEAMKNADGTSQNDVTRLRNEQGLLNILIARSRDISAHTRKQVLQTWAYLCKEHAVPIGHWNLVSELAAGRLEDNTVIVRKNALQLLGTLLEYNPFGPSLRAAAFEATHEKYSEKLSGMSPRNSAASNGVDEAGKTPQDMELDSSAEQENSSEGAPSSPGTKEGHSKSGDSSPETQQSAPYAQFSTEVGGLEHTRALVASLESAARFAKCIGSTMDTLSQLLASSNISDVQSTIQLLIICKKFEVDGAGPCLRHTIPLVFSQEAEIQIAVEEAFKTLYLTGAASEVASNLINLTREASLGDLASIEELVSRSMLKRKISAGTVSSLWDFFTFNAQGSSAGQSRAALTVLSMAAKSTPQILSTHVLNILDIGFGRWAKDDVLLARSACIALQRLPESDRASFRRSNKIFSILSNLIVGPGLSEACWYSASEQAIKAIYALHPAPESLSSGILLKLARTVFVSSQRSPSSGQGTEDGDTWQPDYALSSVSAVAASRFLFAVAHVALTHLVYIESCQKLVRKQWNANDMRAANGAAEESLADVDVAASKDEDIAGQLGLAASEDGKLDDLADQAETEIINGDMAHTSPIGAIAPMVSILCSNSALMQQNQLLRSSALLALCKLMVIDAQFWFPNLVEPWMESMYARVHDKSTAVRKNTVLVLSHLILNDLIKVKGYISEMAMHVEDEDSRISNLVKLFFYELSKKGNNPIHNLLPEIVSRLSSNPALSQDQFNSVMEFLISTIKKCKQMEGLVEKFCNRFPGTSNPRQWQDIAYCLSQLSYPLSCLKKLSDSFKLYQHALGDTAVFGHFKSLIVKTKKLAPADIKPLLVEIEEKIDDCHKEMKEQEGALQKAQEHYLRQKEQEEALLAQSLGELNLGRSAAQDAEVETQIEDEVSVVDLQQREATFMETPTIIAGNQEPIEQNVSIGIQNNDVEGDDGHRTGAELQNQTEEEASVVNLKQKEARSTKIGSMVAVKPEPIEQSDLIGIQNNDGEGDDGHRTGAELEPYDEDEASVVDLRQKEARETDATAPTSVEAELEADLDRSGSVVAPNVVEHDEYGDFTDVNGADSTVSESQSLRLSQGFGAMRISGLDSPEEDTGGTQPYPYMDIDLESASTQDPLESASSDEETEPENEEIQHTFKENPRAVGHRSDHEQMPSSPFIPAPPSLESSAGVKHQKARKSFLDVKEERSPLHEGIARRSRVLRPHNEKG